MIGTELLNYLKKIKTELSLNVYVRNNLAVSFYMKQDFMVVEEKVDEAVNENEYTMCWRR